MRIRYRVHTVCVCDNTIVLCLSPYVIRGLGKELPAWQGDWERARARVCVRTRTCARVWKCVEPASEKLGYVRQLSASENRCVNCELVL